MSTDLQPSLAVLPNAVHIARVLASLKANPKAWATSRADARDTAWATARGAAWTATWADARDAARDTAWATALDALAATRNAARGTAWGAAGGALLALIAWDDSARLLSLTPDQLQAHHMVTEDPAAVLLMPAVTVFAQEKGD